MSYTERRKKLFGLMKDNSALILYSGIELHISSDTYFDFQVNRNFFYLTGIRRIEMCLLMEKIDGKETETLFIEPIDPSVERWVGKKMTVEEAKSQTGIESVRFIDSLPSAINMLMNRKQPEVVYFDSHRNNVSDLPDYNAVKAKEFIETYPGFTVADAHNMIASLRMNKDQEEVDLTKKAIEITKEALDNVLHTLKPSMYEYQAKAEFDYVLAMNGADGEAFPTIAGSGMNGTMLHYEDNNAVMQDNTLVLLDLGARYAGYNADITRTYPVNGKYTERQKEFYNIVLEANKEIARVAKPGMTLLELNNITKKVLADGMIKLGKIKEESEISKYYMHSVSHHLGIDVHDVTVREKAKLEPGMIITDEPGLYIDEEAIGIRIEDDLLITEDGCVVLSSMIPKEIEDIEREMKNR